jgi:signal transduction histidine kinase
MEKITSADNLSENNNELGLATNFLLLDIPKIAISSANIGTWFFDQETQTFLPSARMKELFGFLPDEEMSFDAAINQIPEKYKQKVISTMKEAANKNEPFYMEYPAIGFHDKIQRWLRIMGGVDKPTDTICHFSGVIMDITEQKQNELRRSKFIGMVSHELKTPLTTLKAYIQLLSKWAKQKKDNLTIGTLTKLEKQVKKMTIMINGFLNLSGVESGKIHLKKQYFLLNELVKEVIEESNDITSDHNITLIADNDIKVYADREKIEQVIVNLVSNAIKYSDKGMPVEISCDQNEVVAKLSVRDKGMGIEQKYISKLFKPHSRIKTTQTEKISGFGIGLYLCTEIIKYHGGQIDVETEIGKGSTFWFTLPMQDIAVPTASELEEST